MAEMNPFSDVDGGDAHDRALVARAQVGDRGALEELVRRHQRWIYNIAIRMLYQPQDAEDVTQEALIKALTRLSSFEGRSRFRTWLYRIAINHILNAKRSRLETPTVTFGCYGHGLDRTPDFDVPDRTSAGAELRLLVDEARLTCTAGMLMCLDRPQRIAYILGEIFEVSDTVAAELLEITPDGFRQRLARARRDLHRFMNDKCGLVNRANPCRCARKTRGFIEAGYVDPTNLLFAREHVRQIREILPARAAALASLDEQHAEIFRQHPFHDSPDQVAALRALLQSRDFRRAADPA